MEMGYGRYSASKTVPACKCVMETEFQVKARAFFTTNWSMSPRKRSVQFHLSHVHHQARGPMAFSVVFRPHRSSQEATKQQGIGIQSVLSQSFVIWKQRNNSSPPGSYYKPTLGFAEMFMGVLVIIT